MEHSGEQNLLWGMRHMFHSTGYFATICINGRLSATTSEMRSAMSELNDERGYQFNSAVAVVLERDGRIVEPRKRTFGSLKMPRELGDLDVLVIEPAKHRVAVIECKNIALARTPQELAGQLESLTGTGGTEHTQGAAMARHGRRLKWVRENLSAVLAHFGIEDVDGWGGEGHVRGGRTSIRNAPSRYWNGGSFPGISARESRALRTKGASACLLKRQQFSARPCASTAPDVFQRRQ